MTAMPLTESEQRDIELAAYADEVELLRESLADIELAMEDQGWQSLTRDAEIEFSREGRRKAAALCRILSIQNPLIKRGLAVRTGYVWGDGVQISADDPDVNAVIQYFLDLNESSYAGAQAREEAEKLLGTDGDVFRALPTDPYTGMVRVRSVDPSEIEKIITNPEDADEPWFYLRQYTVEVIEAGYTGLTRTRAETRRVLYPALGFRPSRRPRVIDGIPVEWGTPMQHIAVNRIDGWSFGIGDAYAAIWWARSYKEFLEAWSQLMKALSKYAYKLTAPRRRGAEKAAEKVRSVHTDGPAGQTAVGTEGYKLEAIPKSGATIDAESGRPLAGMVAAALSIPVTMLLADPGATGARAVAETLDEPMKHEMQLRRRLHESADRQLLDYVIDMAVKAPGGTLKGIVRIDEFGFERVELADERTRKVSMDWPSLDKVSLETIVDAIVKADDTGKVPPLTIARLLLVALSVKDVDEVLKELQDKDGNFVDPRLASGVNAGQAAVDAMRRGQVPSQFINRGTGDDPDDPDEPDDDG